MPRNTAVVPARPAHRSAATGPLDELDTVLDDLRRAPQRPGYRRRLFDSLMTAVEPSTIRVLRSVERSDEPPSIGDIAEQLSIDPSSASRLVDTCVLASLLVRRVSDRDRRRTQLALTTDGRELLERVTIARRRMLAEVTAGWTAPDLKLLLGLMASLRDGYDELEARR